MRNETSAILRIVDYVKYAPFQKKKIFRTSVLKKKSLYNKRRNVYVKKLYHIISLDHLV